VGCTGDALLGLSVNFGGVSLTAFSSCCRVRNVREITVSPCFFRGFRISLRPLASSGVHGGWPAFSALRFPWMHLRFMGPNPLIGCVGYHPLWHTAQYSCWIFLEVIAGVKLLVLADRLNATQILVYVKQKVEARPFAYCNCSTVSRFGGNVLMISWAVALKKGLPEGQSEGLPVLPLKFFCLSYKRNTQFKRFRGAFCKGFLWKSGSTTRMRKSVSAYNSFLCLAHFKLRISAIYKTKLCLLSSANSTNLFLDSPTFLKMFRLIDHFTGDYEEYSSSSYYLFHFKYFGEIVTLFLVYYCWFLLSCAYVQDRRS